MRLRAPDIGDVLAPLPLLSIFGLLVIAFWGTVMVHQYRRMFLLEQVIYHQRDELQILRTQWEATKARADQCCLCSMPSTRTTAAR